MLALLENSPSAWAISLATMRGRSLDAASLSALTVDFEIPFLYLNPRDPSRTTGRQWHFPRPQIQAAYSRLVSHEPPPSMVLQALPRIVGVWSLAAAVKSALDLARARDVAQSMNSAIGGVTTLAQEWPATSTIPLPGTASSVDHPGLVVTCTLFEPGRLYSLADLAAPKKGKS